MGWTQEDTEVYQLMNRVRQLMHKKNREGYEKFGTTHRAVGCDVGDITFRLIRDSYEGLTIWSNRNTSKPVRLFKVALKPAGPDYIGDLGYIRDVVIPAIDREMVLEDLSLLGE